MAATLESITAQTYPHYKILVWDNGSTDGTLELLHKWIPSRIPGRIVEDRPLRLGPAMAALVEMADTELCAVIHGDDLNLPSRLEQQVAFMQSHPGAGVVGGQIDVIDEHGTVQDTGPFWKYETDDASVRWRLRWHAQFCHPGVMLRRAAVLQAGNYRDLQPFEDLDLWQRMANTSELWNLAEKVVQYRRTSTSSTGAIVEYLPLDREAASLNSGILFPGLPRERVMDLWEATHPYNLESPSKFRHIFQIERAAINLAKALGKPTDYFVKTALFQRQQDTLKKRFYARVGLLPLSALRQRILHLGHN